MKSVSYECILVHSDAQRKSKIFLSYFLIYIIRNNTHCRFVATNVASHIVLNHSDNLFVGIRVVLSDSLTAKETSLLSAVPMEFDGTFRCKTIVNKATESFQDSDGAASIVLNFLFVGILCISFYLHSTTYVRARRATKFG